MGIEVLYRGGRILGVAKKNALLYLKGVSFCREIDPTVLVGVCNSLGKVALVTIARGLHYFVGGDLIVKKTCFC